MSKRKNIKIPLPNWKWWQADLIICSIIVVIRLEPNGVLKAVKEVVIVWLSG